MRRITWKEEKFKSYETGQLADARKKRQPGPLVHTIFLPIPQPTITTSEELSRAVCRVDPRTCDRAKFIFKFCQYHILQIGACLLTWLSYASSTAPRCSASFSALKSTHYARKRCRTLCLPTSGTKMRPINMELTPLSLTRGSMPFTRSSLVLSRPVKAVATRTEEHSMHRHQG